MPSSNNLTEAHVLDALRRQYKVELPQIRLAVSYLRDHFRNPHPWVITRCSRTASTSFLSGQLPERDEMVPVFRFEHGKIKAVTNFWGRPTLADISFNTVYALKALPDRLA